MSKETENRDSIDFGTTPIRQLFMKMFWPTLLSMLCASVMNVADGIFVGQGVGSDALAAVNIAAPLYMIATGISLMFGSGASIVAAIHLSQDNTKAARINMTQAYIVGLTIITAITLYTLFRIEDVAYAFGSSERLISLVTTYIYYILPCLPFAVIDLISVFMIRLDGSPKYAMYCTAIPSALNFVLDYVMVFPMGMGLKGAAIATTISQGIGAMMALFYVVAISEKLRPYRLKISETSAKLTLRNTSYMMKVGFPSLIGEFAISCMMIVGNYAFMSVLGEDGVASFSIVCYCMPFVFMGANSVSQAMQPVLSYNYGARQEDRIKESLKICIVSTLSFGVLLTIAGYGFSYGIAGLFIDKAAHAYELTGKGFPLFSSGLIFFVLNVMLIGYFQSIEKTKHSTMYMLLRGFIIIIPCFIILPKLIGEKGLWLANPLSELITFAVIAITWPKKDK